MGNLMTSMYTGVSGLMVSQVSINTTAHNISNVNTPGFTRQQILTSDFVYNKVAETANSYMQVGLGTDMASIRQVRDVFLDKSYRLEVGRGHFYEAQYETVEEIETLFGELDGVAFKNQLSDMWTAISELAKEPDSTVKRGTVVTTAQSFLQRAEIIKNQLDVYQTNLNKQINEKVDRINEIGDSIKTLNKIIRTQESSGQSANDYRDTRNQLLDELGGLISMTYSEDAYGTVAVSLEGVQFVTEDKVFHLETRRTITDEEQGRADIINGYIKEIKDMVDASGDTITAIADTIKASDAWNGLSKYGKVSITPGGELKYNTYTAIEADGTVNEVLPKQSDLLTVYWTGNGCGEVFRLDGNYNSEANTNIGSLKGLLVSRGAYAANYTDIPLEENYPSLKEFKEAIKEYNRYVDPSVVMSTQAQYDQLMHSIITTINDILCPNTEITKEVISDYLSKTRDTEVSADTIGLDDARVVLADGTSVKASEVRIFDAIKAGCGMDSESTQAEELFSRKNTERYTKGTLTYTENGVEKTMDVLVYNEEYSSDVYSLYTIGETQINEEILNDYNKIPLSNNKYSGLFGSFNQTVCAELIDAWDKDILKLNPNTLTKNNFQDYYSAMTTDIAYRGSTYNNKAESQSDMVESIDNQRQQVAGVSSDDELTNLIRFQHAYNASSRYITVISDMLEHVIERLG